MKRIAAILAAAGMLAACGGGPVDERLVGTWQATAVVPAGPVTMRLTTAANGEYTTTFYSRLPLPNDSGTLTAADGEWRMEKVTGGVEEGTYRVLEDGSVLFESRTGPVLWSRVADASAAPPVATASGSEQAPTSTAPTSDRPPTVLFNPGPDRPARPAAASASTPPPSASSAPREDLTDPQRRLEANMRAREEAARRSREAAEN